MELVRSVLRMAFQKHLTPYQTKQECTDPLEEALRKHCRKRRKCWFPAFSPFPTMFSVQSKTNCINLVTSYPFPKQQILDFSKLKEIADDNVKLHENGQKISKRGRKYCGEKEKLLIMGNFSFSHCVFKRLVLQKLKKPGLVWEKANCHLQMLLI